MQDTSSAIQNTEDLLKNLEKGIMETLNETKALDKEIGKYLPVKTGAFRKVVL